ncbi:hypothetical protein ABPG72_011467 [Tetrahymena utriculariae]
MKSVLDVSASESYVSLPKIETKNQIIQRNTFQNRISTIRESQDNIQKLEQMSQEFIRDTEKYDQPFSFIQLPTYFEIMKSYNFINYKDEGKCSDNQNSNQNGLSHHNQQAFLGHHYSQTTTHKKSVIKQNSVFDQQSSCNASKQQESFTEALNKEKKIFRSQSQQNNLQQKFKKIKAQKSIVNQSSIEEEMFIKENWNDQQKYELQTGETLNFLFKNLAENMQNLVKYKSEKYCIKVIEKNVNYNKKLKKLIDIENTSFKEYNAALLLQRYLRIHYKNLQFIQNKQNINQNNNINSLPQQSNNQQINSNADLVHQQQLSSISNNQTIISKEESKISQGDTKSKDKQIAQSSLVHDKQFLDNILDLNTRLEDWIMMMQKVQIDQFSNQLVDITEQVFEKEITYKNQLINHQKKQSYLELKQMIKSKYSLNLRIMKSNLSQQIKACEEKNGDIKFVHKQCINKGDCIDKVIGCIEKLDLY